MPVLVLGAGGWIGSAVMRRLPEARAAYTRQQAAAALAELSNDDVVVNAAGRRSGTDAELVADNVTVVQQALDRASWVVQLGSAAEYGLTAHSPVHETTICRPSAPYGQCKLRATQAAVASGRATVLRLFNLIDSPPQPGSPIADIWARIQRGVADGTAIEVLSGGTVRDYASRDFVAEAIVRAVQTRPAGIFNIGSGLPVAVRDIATAAAAQLASDVPVRDLQEVPATAIWCDPSTWETASGMREQLAAADVAAFLTGRPRIGWAG